MVDRNRLTEQVLNALFIESEPKNFREVLDEFLERAWHDGYDAGQEDQIDLNESLNKDGQVVIDGITIKKKTVVPKKTEEE